jgi:hypothetical protein
METHVNPVTKRKLDPTKATYKGLMEQCLQDYPVNNNNNDKRVDVSNSDVDSKISHTSRSRLQSALKKVLTPLLNKFDTIDNRIRFSKIITQYLSVILPCLVYNEEKGVLCLVDKNNNPVVKFIRRIGSESAYGVAYMNAGSGFARPFKFSVKLMIDIPNHTKEVKLLERMTEELVKRKRTPNLPMMYKYMVCPKACTYPGCPPKVTRNSKYLVVFSELADGGDLHDFFKIKRTSKEYESVIVQILFAVYSFRSLGYAHMDCHFGNFLIHNINPGGYWRYWVNGSEVFVPNCGFLVVSWDPGMAVELKKAKNKYFFDYENPLNLIAQMESNSDFKKMGLVSPMDDQVISAFIHGFIDDLLPSIMHNDDKALMTFVVQKMIKRMFRHVIVDGKTPESLLNIRPFDMGW